MNILSFDAHYAESYGVNEAIVLHHIMYHVWRNAQEGRHRIKNRTWMYASAENFRVRFPHWSGEKIRRILNSLVRQGAVKSDRFNKKSYDRTKWYCLDIEDWQRMNLLFRNQRKSKSATIPQSCGIEGEELWNQYQSRSQVQGGEYDDAPKPFDG